MGLSNLFLRCLLHSTHNPTHLFPSGFSPSSIPQNPARQPTHANFLRLLRCCNSIDFLRKLHTVLVVTGLVEDQFLAGETIHKYLGFGDLGLALSVFTTTIRPSLSLQNFTIKCLLDYGYFAELLRLYARLQNSPSRCSDHYTFPPVAKACAAISSLRAGKEVHAVVLRTGYGGNVMVQTALLDMYAKTGRVELSRRIFDDMPERDLVSWNAMISGYASKGFEEEAFEALRRMQANGLKPNSSTFVTVIPLCRSLGVLDVGISLHGLAYKCGAFGDQALVPTLISMYAAFEDLCAAKLLFEKLTVKDSVVWNAMISANSQNGNWDEAFQVFLLMYHEGVRPNLVTLVSILPSCCSNISIRQGETVHAIGTKFGLADQISVTAALLSMYAKFGDLDSAQCLFCGMPERNLLLWNSMISGYLQNGIWNMGFDAFRDMQLGGIAPDAISIISVISGCTLSKDLHSGKSAHAYSIRNGFDMRTDVINALLALYCDCNHCPVSLKLFRRMRVRNVISWNTIISGWAEVGDTEASVTLFCEMRREGVQFDLITMVSILTCFYMVKDFQCGTSFHALAIKDGHELDTSLRNALISMYTNCGDVEAGQRLFSSLPLKSIISWNALMTGYRKHNLFKKTWDLFDQMQMDGLKPNSVTLLNILPLCKTLLQGKSIHAYALRNVLILESSLLTSKMSMYAKFENVDYCHQLFEMMDKRNVVAWNTMMSVYIQTRHSEEAVTSFQEMLWMELEPDHVTMLTLLSACSRLRSLDLAKCVTGFATHKGFDRNTSVGNSLIDMHARCGSISTAKQIFDGLREKDSITWSVMINGYGMHGDGKAALYLFSEMKEAAVEPDDITFVSILSACSHAGLVEDGRMLFRLMLEEYHIAPRAEHYACMVDLFGRTGHLEEAYDLVKSLPFKPSASLLESLLGACRCHSNAEIGEAIGKLLIESNPQSPSSYVLLSNIYATAGRWSDYGTLRSDMEVRGLRKHPGISLVEEKTVSRSP